MFILILNIQVLKTLTGLKATALKPETFLEYFNKPRLIKARFYSLSLIFFALKECEP